MTESRTPYILSDMTAELDADDPAALRATEERLRARINALEAALQAAGRQIRHDHEGEATQAAMDCGLGASEWEAFMPAVYRDIELALAWEELHRGHP